MADLQKDTVNWCAGVMWTYVYQFLMVFCHFSRRNVAYLQQLVGPYFESGSEKFLEMMKDPSDQFVLLKVLKDLRDRLAALTERLGEQYPNLWTLKTLCICLGFVLYFVLVVATTKILRNVPKDKKGDENDNEPSEKEQEEMEGKADTPGGLGIFDLAKTADQPGHTEAVIKLMQTLKLDVNRTLPGNGLTLFLCACISGERQLVNFMLEKAGADITVSTKAGDSPLYLATFGIINSEKDQYDLLEDLMKAGCDVNAQNSSGYTCLHRAASKGIVPLIKFLLKHGADPYISNTAGIYPIDSAISASHLHAADLLVIHLKTENVWDIVEPHTPAKADLGLPSPHRKHLIESTKSKRKVVLRK
ncbi:ankyrin-3-like [Lineus longissimus]|uniref:ankyrin-3-like n=1 Tax=Lineus longissimus TaxID=88925 RepID=UPI00315DD46E